MTENIKYTEKELKQPDRFTRAIARAVEHIANHFNKIAAIVGIVIVIIIVAYVISLSSAERESEANSLLNRAVENLNAGNEEDALAGFQSVVDQYPDEKISQIAIYYSGVVNYQIGKYDDSITTLDAFLKSSVNQPKLTQSAILTQGLASFNQEKWMQAIDYLSKLDAQTETLLHKQAKLHMAMAYERLGQDDKAESILRELD